MRTISYSGTLTASSSIAHASRNAGMLRVFRRETLFTPDGRVDGVPMISGGVIRGAIRRTAAKMMQHALTGDGQPLPWPVVHVLAEGGSLVETRTGKEMISAEKQAQLRDLVPLIGVFGTAAPGRIISGRLIVDKAVPVAAETAWLAPHFDHDTVDTTVPVHTLIQRESYTRVCGGDDKQALHRHETLAAGTRLWHALIAEDVTPIEADFFRAVVGAWSRNARIGGQAARGMGRVQPRYTETVTDVVGDVADNEPADWREHVHTHREQALDALAWLC